MKFKTKRYYAYYLVKVGGFIIAVLPLKLGLFIGRIGSILLYAFAFKARRLAMENLKIAFPEKSEDEIRHITKCVFLNMCQNFIEWVSMYKLKRENLERWVKIEGIEKVDNALSKKNGILMLASHFGNWELISIYFLLKGYYGGVVARRIYFNRYDKFISRMRTRRGAEVVYRDESPKKILRILKNNGIVGILADQDMDSVDGVFVDFFGKQAYTPKAPVALALASGASLIPCYIRREKGFHRLIIGDPLELEEKPTKEETILFNTQKWTNVIESYLRNYPEQWVWFHKRWKTRPETINSKKRR